MVKGSRLMNLYFVMWNGRRCTGWRRNRQCKGLCFVALKYYEKYPNSELAFYYVGDNTEKDFLAPNDLGMDDGLSSG